MTPSPPDQPGYLRSAWLALRRAFTRRRTLAVVAASAVAFWLLTTALLLCLPVHPMPLALGSWPLSLPGPGGLTAGRYTRAGNGSVDGSWRFTIWVEPGAGEGANPAVSFASMFPAPASPRSPGKFLSGDRRNGGAIERLRGVCDEHGAVEVAAAGWPLPWLMVVSPLKGPSVGSRGLVEDSAYRQRSVLAQYSNGQGVQLGVWYGGAARSLAWHAAVVAGALAVAVLLRHHFKWRAEARARRRCICPACGYSREGLTPAAVCPECGHAGAAAV